MIKGKKEMKEKEKESIKLNINIWDRHPLIVDRKTLYLLTAELESIGSMKRRKNIFTGSWYSAKFILQEKCYKMHNAYIKV